MQEREPNQHLSHDDGCILLLQRLGRRRNHEIRHTSSLGELLDNPNARAVEEAVVISDDIRSISCLSEKSDFALNIDNTAGVVVGFEVDDLYSENLAGGGVASFMD